jgi:thiamine biosynthesis protein ThiI
MKFMPTYILCHYAEIGLKGKNRGFFEGHLVENIRRAVQSINPSYINKITRPRGRIIIELSNDGKANFQSILKVLENVFGIAYMAPAIKTEADIHKISSILARTIADEDYESFRITARRADSEFPYSSQQLNEIVGAYIVKKFNKQVNLSNPELTCYIDVLKDEAYIFISKIRGSGGLPVGASGKVAVLLSGGIDSPVAAYYALKRGGKAVFVHFHSVPYVTEASIDKVRDTIEIMKKFQPESKLYLIEFAPIQTEIMEFCEPKYRVLHYRRFMVAIAAKIARREKAKALITGEALGQVASQTLENIAVIEDAAQLPILRPLIGFDKQEIINKAQEIGTYDISILPHQDCCTLFVPKHPATKARLSDVHSSESNLEVESLVNAAVENATVEYFDSKLCNS